MFGNRLAHYLCDSFLAFHQVALVGRILLVEELLLLVFEQLLLVVKQLPNLILSSIRVSMRSLMVVEVTCILFRIRLLQSSV